MIDERLAFHSFMASDKQLDGISARFGSESAMRPDLFVFDEAIICTEGDKDEQPIKSITVEFKRPGRNDYNELNNLVKQSFDLIEKIRAGWFVVRGRPVSVANDKIPATCYAVCDLTPTLRKVLDGMDAYVTPDNQGYYGFHRNYKVYWEVIEYNKLLRDAEKRNRIFFDRLNILGNR